VVIYKLVIAPTMELNLVVKKLDAHAKAPIRSTDFSAAYDLYALEDGKIPMQGKAIIRTGVAIRLPKLPEPFKVYGSIRSRSGLSAKFSLETGAGVIDYDYVDEIRVILHNHGNSDYSYLSHDRIGQLILEVHITPPVIEVEEFEPIETNRIGGFGSTGN
jgi:dUTP pyrophosphatase